MDKNKKNRIEYLDIAKAFAIICMVAGHCDGPIGKVANIVSMFHMALFTFISGYFFRKNISNIKELINYLIKRLWKIYWFYLKCEIIYFCLTNFFFLIGFYSSDVYYGDKIITPINSIYDFLFGILKIIMLMGREPFCGAFWYLISLMFMITMFSIIVYLSNKQKIMKPEIFKFISVMIVFFVGCCMNYYKFNIPRVSPACTLLLAYYLGNQLQEGKLKCKFENTYLFIVFCLGFIYVAKDGYVAMNSNHFSSISCLILSATFGIYIICFLSKKIALYMPNISNTLQYIGRNTLAIMAWHFISFKGILILQLLFGKIQWNGLAKLSSFLLGYDYWYIASIIFGVGLSLIFHETLNFWVNYFKKNFRKSIHKHTNIQFSYYSL